MVMKLYRSDVERFPPTAQAVCAVIFLIALASCKDQNTRPQQSQSLIQPSVSPEVSIATPTPQAKSLQAPPTPYPPNTYKRPKEGYVPDAATAIKIAEAVWIPIYGEETLKNEK